MCFLQAAFVEAEPNPYCFKKIVDQLRLIAIAVPGDPPPAPIVAKHEEQNFEVAMQSYFAGHEDFVQTKGEFRPAGSEPMRYVAADTVQREIKKLARQDGEKVAAEHLKKTAAKLKKKLGDEGDCELTCSLSDEGIGLLAASKARWRARQLFGMSETEMLTLGLSAADSAALSSCLRAWESENAEEAEELKTRSMISANVAEFIEQLKAHGCELSDDALAVVVGYLHLCAADPGEFGDLFDVCSHCNVDEIARRDTPAEYIEDVMRKMTDPDDYRIW
eukprot:COSAG04_NODE_5739_length_1506_cov_1.019190_1_plen_276_part_10